ncbi:hypothetical protein ACHAWF_007733 [Thalassiosira exigua]
MNSSSSRRPPPSPATLDTHDAERVHAATHLTDVSDGSLDPVTGRAAFSWILTLPDKEAYVKQRKPVRANPRYMTSYRAKMAGICDLLTYIDDKKLTDAHIVIWCDNVATTKVLSSDQPCSLVDISSAESDLVRAARKILLNYPHITFQHLLGHQNDDTPYELLSFEAQLNVDCDHETKDCAYTDILPSTRPDPLPGSGAMLYLNNMMVTTINDQIRYAAHAKATFEFYKHKYE